jgi:hypothetical protein
MSKILTDRVKLIRSLQSALNNGFTDAEKGTISGIIHDICIDVKQHFLSLSQEIPGKVSYATKPEYRMNTKSRMRTTLRRYIRRQLNVGADVFCDKSLFDLGGYIHRETIAEDNLDSRIQILKGQDIVRHYSNTTTDSCMTGSDSWKVQIYADNPDKVGLVVLDGYVRALLWECDDGVAVLDRIYPNGCDAVSVLQGWADRKGYKYRISDGFCEEGMIEVSDDREHSVTLIHNEVFPYMDTFCYARFNCDGTLVLSNDSDFGSIELQNTNGGHSDSNICYSCDSHITVDDTYAAFDNDYCYECFNNHFFYCTKCGGETRNDIRVTVNDRDYCPDCADELFVQCEDCCEHYDQSDLQEVHSGDTINQACPDCLDDYTRCVVCEGYYDEGHIIKHEDSSYCPECFEEHVSSPVTALMVV